jgi:hypothetical protein
LEVKTTDVKEALQILKRDFIQSTGLIHHDISTIDMIFDENAATTVCPACGTTFIPNSTKTCPDCGLWFG